MKSLTRLAGLSLLGLALIFPALAGEDKKATKEDEVGKAKAGKKVELTEDDTKDEKKTTKKGTKKGTKTADKKFSGQPNLMGKLTQMDPNSQRDFIVQVTVYEPNPGGWNHLAQLQQRLVQQQFDLARINPRDFNGQRNTLNAINNTRLEIMQASQPQKLYQPKNVDIKLRAAEDIKVRWNFPPPDYDEKGNLKKYTKEELKALKGDEGLPGYKGEYDALRQGQTVAVYLVNKTALKGLKTIAPKGAKGKKAPPPTKGKKIDEDDEVGLQDRHEVRTIVILAEPKQQ